MRAATNVHTSIIIPSRNHASMLKRLVDGLARTAQNFEHTLELIIVDNKSDESDAVDYLHSLSTSPPEIFDVVQVLRYPHKFNYAAINNWAATHSNAQYLCLLNNDIEITDTNWLSALVKPMKQSHTGCVGAMLYYPDNTIQHAGVYLDKNNIAGHLYKDLPKGSSGQNDFLLSDQSVCAVTAACLLVKRDLFEQVNGFNESLAVAFNDVDFCLRIQQAGFQNIWTPHATLIHHESKSRGKKNQRSWLQKRRHKKEVKLMQQLWSHLLDSDANRLEHVTGCNPAYNSLSDSLGDSYGNSVDKP